MGRFIETARMLFGKEGSYKRQRARRMQELATVPDEKRSRIDEALNVLYPIAKDIPNPQYWMGTSALRLVEPTEKGEPQNRLNLAYNRVPDNIPGAKNGFAEMMEDLPDLSPSVVIEYTWALALNGWNYSAELKQKVANGDPVLNQSQIRDIVTVDLELMNWQARTERLTFSSVDASLYNAEPLARLAQGLLGDRQATPGEIADIKKEFREHVAARTREVQAAEAAQAALAEQRLAASVAQPVAEPTTETHAETPEAASNRFLAKVEAGVKHGLEAVVDKLPILATTYVALTAFALDILTGLNAYSHPGPNGVNIAVQTIATLLTIWPFAQLMNGSRVLANQLKKAATGN